MRKSMRLAALTAAVALVLTSCGSGEGDKGVKTGGHLILGTLSNIDTLNPFRTFQQNSYSTFEYVYPQLVQLDLETLEYVPDFAQTWETSTDGLVWTFHTVPNAKWSDGQPLTANDAAFTFGTIVKFADGPAAFLSGGLSHVAKVEATDDNTLVITYSAPVSNVLSNLQQLSILPQHVWEPYAAGNGRELRHFPEPTDQPLVSGGPFVLAKYVKDQDAIFQKNPTFYGAKAAIDGFGLQYFTNDDAMVSALRNGQIQAAINVPVTAVEALKGDGDLTVYTGPGISMRDFIINSSPEKTTNLELQDPTVRMAMEYAIDRDAIVQTAWLGYAEPGSTIVSPATGHGWHNSEIQPLPFDTDQANTLLDQAGYDKGADGIRVANGHPMSYTVLFASDEIGAGDAAFRIIQNGFDQIGIRITQRTMGNDAVNTAILGDNETYETFDLAMWDWFPLIDPDFILSVLTRAQWASWSDTGYDNPAYDKLYEQQGLALDPADRLQIVHKMQQIVYDDRPYIILNYNQTIDAWSNDWAGFAEHESVLGLFNNLSKTPFSAVHQA